jgi:hypothetical protein
LTNWLIKSMILDTPVGEFFGGTIDTWVTVAKMNAQRIQVNLETVTCKGTFPYILLLPTQLSKRESTLGRVG